MKNLYRIIPIICLIALIASCKKTASLKMVFSSQEDVATFNWKLDDFTPALPADWTDFNYLVLEMKASSPERIDLGPITPDGTVVKTMRPFPGAWLRFVIPLEFYRELPPSAVDMAATYNKGRPLGQINIHTSGLNPVTKVDGFTFLMRRPINNPTLEIRTAYLTVENPGDTVLQEGYLVDRFGQWATDDWPDKIKTEAQLQQDWKSETAAFKPIDLSKYSQYGGYKNKKVAETGFFRVEKIDGKWWFVDPEGYLFLSVGSNCMNASSTTRTTDREYIYEGLRQIANDNAAGFNRGDAARPNRTGDAAQSNRATPQPNRGGADYYGWNIRDRYGDNYRTEWVNTAIMRMNSWGLNTIANWSSNEMAQSNRAPFTLSLRNLQLSRDMMGFPDIYQPGYEADTEASIKEFVEQYKDNKWLLGYFIGNEQPWPGQEVVLCNRILAGDSEMKKALAAYLEKNGDNDRAKVDFVYESFGKFLEMVNRLLKKHDPNHLNLGMRFVDCSDRLIEIIGNHFDVFSINSYRLTPPKDYMDRIDRLTGRPILIGEYHFGTPGRGMSAGLVQMADHKERGNAFRYYNEQGYAHPALIGTHWFQWIDQPNTGRGDGENYNIGLVDVTDRPYPDMTKAIRTTFERLFDVHNGNTPPYNVPPIQSYK